MEHLLQVTEMSKVILDDVRTVFRIGVMVEGFLYVGAFRMKVNLFINLLTSSPSSFLLQCILYWRIHFCQLTSKRKNRVRKKIQWFRNKEKVKIKLNRKYESWNAEKMVRQKYETKVALCLDIRCVFYSLEKVVRYNTFFLCFLILKSFLLRGIRVQYFSNRRVSDSSIVPYVMLFYILTFLTGYQSHIQ